MSREKDPYNIDLARTLEAAFNVGQAALTVRELAAVHFGTDHLGGEIIAGIQDRLPALCAILEAKGRPVHTVSATYFTEWRGRATAPDNLGDARRCLPLGHGKMAVGVRLSTGTDDMIYRAYCQLGLKLGAGRVKHASNRLANGMNDHRIPVTAGLSMIETAVDEAKPTVPVTVPPAEIPAAEEPGA